MIRASSLRGRALRRRACPRDNRTLLAHSVDSREALGATPTRRCRCGAGDPNPARDPGFMLNRGVEAWHPRRHATAIVQRKAHLWLKSTTQSVPAVKASSWVFARSVCAGRGDIVRFLRITQLACLIAVCTGGIVFGQALLHPARESLPDRELVVATKEAAPFAMKGSDGAWRGISIDLWRHVADRLHLRYRLVEMTTVQDLIAATSTGQVDAAVAAVARRQRGWFGRRSGWMRRWPAEGWAYPDRRLATASKRCPRGAPPATP